MASGTPNSYRDPYWSDLAAGTEKKLGLPAGLLVSVLNNREKSNADQVSEANARTPFQVTPTTRKLVLERDGIDAYLSPQNAAEVAGIVLNDGLNWAKQRTQDSDLATKLAAGYYHAGGDTANWGPRTDSYIARVSAGMQPLRQETLDNDFARWMEAHPAIPVTTPAPAAVAAAPKRDQMNAGFAKYLAGNDLPPGAPLGDRAPVSGALPVPGPPPPSIGERLAAMPGRISEAVTGAERATPESQSLPEWTGMPEMNQLSMASAKSGLGSLLANADETAQILKANFPGMAQRRDSKGNWIFTSPSDGKDYFYPPGLTLGDAPRVLGALAAFTPAGRAVTIPGAAVAAGATQAVIEASRPRPAATSIRRKSRWPRPWVARCRRSSTRCARRRNLSRRYCSARGAPQSRQLSRMKYPRRPQARTLRPRIPSRHPSPLPHRSRRLQALLQRPLRGSR